MSTISTICLLAVVVNGYQFVRTKDSFRYVWLAFGVADTVLAVLTAGVL